MSEKKKLPFCSRVLRGRLQKGTAPPRRGNPEHRQAVELGAEVGARSRRQHVGNACYSSKTGDSHGQGQAFCFSNAPNVQSAGLFFEGKLSKNHIFLLLCL